MSAPARSTDPGTVPLTLAIEASTQGGSVAVARGTVLLAERTAAIRGPREERLMPAVVAVLGDCGLAPSDVRRVVCGAGPGSFTGLRIAASIAKGLALAQRCPLVPVGSLLLILAGAQRIPAPGRYLALLDAMRGERYAAEVHVGADGLIEPLGPVRLVPAAEVAALADRLGARRAGPAEELELHPHARGVARLDALLAAAAPVDLASWEPDYGRVAAAQARWEAAQGRVLGPSAAS